jgi:hypothetical protein
MKYIYIFVLSFKFLVAPLYAADELFIYGSGSTETVPTLLNNSDLIFVAGGIQNNDGLVVNDKGTIELTGNWTNTINKNKYQSSGTEKFYGIAEQTISGTMNGTTTTSGLSDNQFYNLKVYRNSTITTLPFKYLSLYTNTNVANTIDFEPSTPNTLYAGSGNNQAVIRTNPSSPSDVATYQYEIYLENPLVTSLMNYAPLSGNGTVKYIEGKLRRQVNAAATYDFPIGFAPNVKDGMEGYSLKFNAAPSSKSILAYIEDPTQAPLYRNVLCDVGKDPGPGVDPFLNCVGGPDGIRDLYFLEPLLDLSNDWKAIASDAAGTINYDITLYPGTILDNLPKYYVIPATCSNPYQGQLLRVVAKDGVVGGTTQPGPGNYAPFSSLISYLWCNFSQNVQPIGLSGQTSFSTFRIHGTSLNASTVLPVELISFQLKPIDNKYFQLDWQTASELNNYGYEVQRSTNAVDFTKIGLVSGHGTTALPNAYTFDDHNVTVETDYYYRLKILDNDGKFTYSNILTGRLKANNTFTVTDFYPNPTYDHAQIDIYVLEDGKLKTTVYDILGQIMKQDVQDIFKGVNKLNYNFETLAKAGYAVSFVYDNKTIVKKLIKQ